MPACPASPRGRLGARKVDSTAARRGCGGTRLSRHVLQPMRRAGARAGGLRARPRAGAPQCLHYLQPGDAYDASSGQLAEAEEDYDQLIRARPNDFEAYRNRSELRTQTRARNHVAELEKLLTRGISDARGEVEIRYALAKEYEDLGEYARSWIHLELAAKLHRRHQVYHVDRDVQTVRHWIIAAFPQTPRPTALAETDPPAMGQPVMGQPIFIVGLPRSGITPVERILGSHSSVESAGELNDFSQALLDVVLRSAHTRTIEREELIARSAKIDFPALGREYLERARPAAGPQDPLHRQDAAELPVLRPHPPLPYPAPGSCT